MSPPDSDGDTLDPLETDQLYERYLETCRRLCVEAVPRDRAQDLIAEWSYTIAIGRSVPPLTHLEARALNREPTYQTCLSPTSPFAGGEMFQQVARNISSASA